MCHPKTFLSKPEEKRLQVGEFSFQATDDTIRLCPIRDVLCSRAILCPFKSNSRIERLSCGIAMTPDCETASRLTGESVRIVVSGARMFRSSQILTDLSSEPDMTLSSLLKIVEVTDSQCPWKTETAGISARKSHNLKVLSRELVTTSRWLWCAEQCVSSLSWPVNVWIDVFVSISQSIADLSHEAVIICVGESVDDEIQSAATTTEEWPVNSCKGVRSVSILSRSSIAWGSSISSSSSSSDEWPRRDEVAAFSQLTAPRKMWVFVSPDAVRSRSLDGWNLILLTEPPWPSYFNKHRPVSILQIHARWSALAVATSDWVGLAVTSQTPSEWHPEKSRTKLLTIDCVLKLDTILLVCALIRYPAFVPLAVSASSFFVLSFFPSEFSKSIAVEGRSFSLLAAAPLSLVYRFSCSWTKTKH